EQHVGQNEQRVKQQGYDVGGSAKHAGTFLRLKGKHTHSVFSFDEQRDILDAKQVEGFSKSSGQFKPGF
ncbi:MAG: hypothetical protein R3350_08290, partial [Saprospiraceae bacterium]|nr:hypothetical protein [Saprospiraceae bacterium]